MSGLSMSVELSSIAEVEKWQVFLTDDESAAAEEKRNAVVKVRFMVGRGMRRKMLSDATGVPALHLRFTESSEGKPVAVNAAGWDFNLSHAGDYVACAVARGAVGIDVEQMRPVREMGAIVSRYYHPDEAVVWRALPPSLREEAFFVLWSAREAAMKCVGLGLAKGLTATRVGPEFVTGKVGHAEVRGAALRLERLAAPQGYVLVVASG
jgi:4'-phosphopantetheinyl transferase